MQLAYIFGRTPRLALEELEATATTLPFHWSITSVQAGVAVLNTSNEVAGDQFVETGFASPEAQKFLAAVAAHQRRLGGTVRIVQLVQQSERSLVGKALQELVTRLAPSDGKLTLGISVWGNGLQPFHVGKALKQALGRSVRLVLPQEGPQLNSAQVFHNHLTFTQSGGKKMELVLIQNGQQWEIGFTLTVQDIEAYSRRDFSIPYPDPVSGMLSPKLAQSMINLAVGGESAATVYDPFCGNGRVVLEAWLMGLKAYGSDIVPKKVESAQKNLVWLAGDGGLEPPHAEELLWVADATQPESRERAEKTLKQPWYIVGEPYLGKPLRQPLCPTDRQPWLDELTPLYLNFLENWSKASNKPQSILLVMPRTRVRDGAEAAVYDQIVDRLADFGYSSEVLFCYDRPDSLVRRDLVKLSFIDR